MLGASAQMALPTFTEMKVGPPQGCSIQDIPHFEYIKHKSFRLCLGSIISANHKYFPFSSFLLLAQAVNIIQSSAPQAACLLGCFDMGVVTQIIDLDNAPKEPKCVAGAEEK